MRQHVSRASRPKGDIVGRNGQRVDQRKSIPQKPPVAKAAGTDDKDTGEYQRDGKRGCSVDALLQQEERQYRRQKRGNGQNQKRVGGRSVLHGRTPAEDPARIEPDDEQPFSVKPLAPPGHGVRGKYHVAKKENAARKQPTPEGKRQHVAADQPHDQCVRDEDHHTGKRHQNPESLRISLCEGCHAVPKSFRRNP